MGDALTLSMVEEAARRISSDVLRTPLLRVEVEGRELWCKAESLQPTGAFKLRGAYNMIRSLADDVGVVTHSSGNHAQAVARAARTLGRRAVIVMPSDAPAIKRSRVEADGAEIVTVGPDSEERRVRALELAESESLVLVPPYDHVWIAAGQGTAALEICEELDAFDSFFAPVSGGGLMAGCATVVHARCPDAEIVAVEPADADDTARSLEEGRRVSVDPPKTIADGLRVRIPGEVTWPINQRLISRATTVDDPAMLRAMKWALENLRLVLEPSGAASLAAALREAREGAAWKRAVVLLSGGNVDEAVLRRALDA